MIYYDKKRDKYYYRVYATINGIRKQYQKCGFKTRRLAKIAEENFLQTSECNQFDNITFTELYDVYIRSKITTLKPQSIRSIKSRFINHILPYFGNKHIFDINNIDFIKWKEHIINMNFKYKYNLSLYSAMVSIFNYACNNYNLPKNIAKISGSFPKNNNITKLNFWTYEEFKKFLSYVDDKVFYTLYYILFFTGMRQGEVLALTWLDFNNNEINVNKTIAKGKNNGNYIITSPKTESSKRCIKIDNKSISLLNDLNKYYRTFVNYSDNWFIFGGLTAMSQTTICRRTKEYCNLANVKHIRIHDFRHSHATFLLSNNIPISVISKRLGHSCISTTLNIYSHFIPNDEDKALKVIDTLEY